MSIIFIKISWNRSPFLFKLFLIARQPKSRPIHLPHQSKYISFFRLTRQGIVPTVETGGWKSSHVNCRTSISQARTLKSRWGSQKRVKFAQSRDVCDIATTYSPIPGFPSLAWMVHASQKRPPGTKINSEVKEFNHPRDTPLVLAVFVMNGCTSFDFWDSCGVAAARFNTMEVCYRWWFCL